MVTLDQSLAYYIILACVLSLKKISFPKHRHIKIVDMEIDGDAVYHLEAESGLLPNVPYFSSVAYPFAL